MDCTESVEIIISKTEDLCKTDNIDLSELDAVCRQYMKNSEEYRQAQAEVLADRGRILAQEMGQAYYYWMTFLLRATESSEIYRELLQQSIKDDTLKKETKFFLYNQLKQFSFLHENVVNKEIAERTDDLYSQIYVDYWRELDDGYTFIPKYNRNKNLVIVLGTQLIGSAHGPTKTLFDRCFIIQKYMDKQVFIVNTAEFMSPYQSIPCFDIKTASYVEEYSEIDGFDYEGERFAFLQCPKEMPQVSVIRDIMNVIQDEKPYFILTIGESLVGDLCSNLVPVIEISTVPSGRIRTKAQFQVIGRRVNEDDRTWMKNCGLPQDHIVESLFTSAFKPQTHQYNRTQLGLPENQFVVLVVGGRLDDEIDEECIQIFNRLAAKGICIAFMGVFNRYTSLIKENELFQKNTVYLGFQEDVLAVNECCDAYLNPKRIGGGTSCAEALYKGLPVVTLDYGDVGIGAGEDFHVESYEDMYNQVLRYAEDREYYALMSQKAKERAAKLTDSKTEFIRVIQTIEQSNRF